jgi:hypothetical protein
MENRIKIKQMVPNFFLKKEGIERGIIYMVHLAVHMSVPLLWHSTLRKKKGKIVMSK